MNSAFQSDSETGVSPADRNRAAMQLAERKPSLLALREDDLVAPKVSPERALELSAHIQTLARDMTGPFPFQADYYNEVLRLAEGALLDDALAYFAAAAAFADREEANPPPSDFATSERPIVALVPSPSTSVGEDTGDDGAADLRHRAYTFWAVDYDKVVRLGRFFAEVPETWPGAADVESDIAWKQ
jgi:hypothetical protein